MMKRSVVALGILGLVCAVALPAASAKELLKEDFSTDKLLKDEKTYVQGRGLGIRGDASLPPFMVRDGVLTSSAEGSTTGSDEVSTDDPDLPGVRYLLLTGDPSWADVSIQSKIMVDSQGTGSVGLVLRAAPKTKPEDPDSWYELRYTTGLPPVLPAEESSGIEQNQDPPSLRIMKVVNGKWTMLAETDASKEPSIPNISTSGDELVGQFVTFRFVAKGNLLQGFISIDGVKFDKFLEATDDELKAGLVGLAHYDYNPIFDDLLVEDAP
jgi:hypothetical protein